jgi:starch synthase (maltosyl-transferring)
MNLLLDIHLEESNNRLVFSNERLKLIFDPASGCWTGLNAPAGLRLFFLSGLDTIAGVQVNGRWLETSQAEMLRHVVQVAADCRSVSLTWAYRIEDEWEWALTYTLFPASTRLERSARLTCLQTSAPRHFERFRFQLPGLFIGDPADCVFDAPGPFPFYEHGKMVLFFPNTPLAHLAGQDLTISSAPDWGFGLLALSNLRFKASVAGWMETNGAPVNYRAGYRSDGRSLDFRFDDERACRLTSGQSVESGRQVLFFASALDAAFAAYRRSAAAQIPLAAQPPAWVQDAVILEVYPKYFPGGLKELSTRLPFYRDLGINTLYLMPHWLGSYSPLDFYTVDPDYGSATDLRQLVAEAHRLGFHVLFDMVIHGFDPLSPVVRQHPEFFCHDENGQIALHPEWKSATVDWAHPGYRRYMAALARHHAEKFGFDGYRVDAASFKGPNWDPALPYPAYLSGTAALELLREMLAAIRAVNPDAVLLNEVFGPLYYGVCDLAHDNMTMGPQIFLEKLALGEATALDYKRHMQAVLDLLPSGARRVYFARNHDTSWFYHFNGYTPAFLALDAVHILLAIPEIFAGDPDHGPNLDDDPEVIAFYRRLLAKRREWPELARGKILLNEVTCDNPLILTGLRQLDSQVTLVAVSFSSAPQTTRISLSAEALPSLELFDAVSGQAVLFTRENSHISLSLSPCQVLVGRFYRE